MGKAFKIYGGTAKVLAIRNKSSVKKTVNRNGYWRKYPKRLRNGHVVLVDRHVKPYKRSLAGTIKKLKIIERR